MSEAKLKRQEFSELIFEVIEELSEQGKELFIRKELEKTIIEVHDKSGVRPYEAKTLRSALIDVVNNETHGSVYIPDEDDEG